LSTAPLPALVLTAGYGTRLRPLTDVRAKPALPVAGQPLVCRVLGWLARSGVTDAVLNLHYRPATVCRAVGAGLQFGVAVRYAWEPVLLGSAGGPARMFDLIDEDTALVVNGDTLCEIDVPAMLSAHRASGCLVTLAVVPNRWPGKYRGVRVDADGRVPGFVDRDDPRPSCHFIGIQIAHRSVFAGVPRDRASETVRELYPALIASRPGAIGAFVSDIAFLDIGTVNDYRDASRELARLPTGRNELGARCHIAASARVRRSILWDDVTIGRGAVVEDCIVTDGVRVPSGSTFARSMLLRDGDGVAAHPMPVESRT